MSLEKCLGSIHQRKMYLFAQYAVMSGNVEAVQLLLGAGVSLDLLSKSHRTPLTQALQCGFKGTQVKENYSAIVTMLVSTGADVNLRTVEACNPLLTATLLKSQVMVNYFLSLGAFPNVKCELNFGQLFLYRSVNCICMICCVYITKKNKS